MSIKDSIERQVVPRARPALVFEESRTKQSFRDQVNINKIIAKYQRTGMIEHVNSQAPIYGDASIVDSYQRSLEVVAQAEAAFAALPAEIRSKFENDPVKLMEFLADDANREEAIKLGLRRKPPPEAQEPEKGSDDKKPSK